MVSVKLNKTIFFWALISIVYAVLSFPLATSAEEKEEQAVNYDLSNLEDDDSDAEYLNSGSVVEYPDAFEPFNRQVFRGNKIIDNLFVKPIAQGYEYIVPEFGRKRVTSFLANLHEPVYFLNHILQGDPDLAAQNFARFFMNTIFGLGGLFDVADTDLSMEQQKTDFGLTLKRYSIGTGPYIMLPLLGPSSLRDAPSLVVDAIIDPFNYHEIDKGLKIARYATELVNTRQLRLKVMEQLEQTSLDEYSTLRSIYLQKR